MEPEIYDPPRTCWNCGRKVDGYWVGIEPVTFCSNDCEVHYQRKVQRAREMEEARAVIAALAQPDEDSLELRAADERSSYLATELNEANSRIERLEAALEAWVDTDKFMVFTEAGERQFALARRLTEEARHDR